MATVHIPALLREFTAGHGEVEVDVPAGERITVRQVLERLDERFPGLMEGMTHEGDLMPGIAVFIDNEQALLGLREKVGAQSTVQFMPPVVGG